MPKGSAHLVKLFLAKTALSDADTVWALLQAMSFTFALSVALVALAPDDISSDILHMIYTLQYKSAILFI